MEPTNQEPTLENSIAQVMRGLPQPIRDYLSSGQYSLIAQGLMKKYGLHLDQGTVLEREIMLLLMGIEAPEAFSATLKTEAKVSEEQVVALMNDLNQQVFVPLQNSMRKPAAKPSPASNSAPVSKTALPPANLPGVIQPKAPMPPQAKPVFAASFAKPGDSPAVHAGAKPAQPQATQASGLAGALKAAGVPLLEDHEEPHIEFKKAAPPPAPAPRVMPTTMPIAPRMQAMPAAPAPKPITPPAIAPIPAPQQQAPVKSYAVDPYREQPDENEK